MPTIPPSPPFGACTVQYILSTDPVTAFYCSYPNVRFLGDLDLCDTRPPIWMRNRTRWLKKANKDNPYLLTLHPRLLGLRRQGFCWRSHLPPSPPASRSTCNHPDNTWSIGADEPAYVRIRILSKIKQAFRIDELALQMLPRHWFIEERNAQETEETVTVVINSNGPKNVYIKNNTFLFKGREKKKFKQER